MASGGGHTRQVSGILGLLCKEHFPGLVEYAGVMGPAYSFDHYTAAPDAVDRAHRVFNNKAERVKQELWVSLPRTTLLNTSHSLDILEIMNGYIVFVCRISLDARTDMGQGGCGGYQMLQKLVVDMHYEARIQAVVTYHGTVLGTKVTKRDARSMTLTQDQYLQVNTEH